MVCTRESSELSESNDQKINQWCDFIQEHLSVRSIAIFTPSKENKNEMACAFLQPKYLFNYISNYSNEKDFLINVESIKEISKIFPIDTNKITAGEDIPDYEQKKKQFSSTVMEKYDDSESHKQMTFGEYLKWRLETINNEMKPFSVKSMIGLATASFFGLYWIFTTETKQLKRILLGILNALAVTGLIFAVTLHYMLIPAAIFYSLFVIANCIHIGFRKYKENIRYKEFYNNGTYNELINYLNQKKDRNSINTLIEEKSVLQNKSDLEMNNNKNIDENKIL